MKKRKNNDELVDLLDRIECPVCHDTIIEHITDICPVCGWEHDLVQSYNHDEEQYANQLSVNQSKEFFRLKRIQNPNYTWKANAKEIGNPTQEDLKKLRQEIENIIK